MRSTVTAVLVAARGGEWLDETISGIAAQSRRPDAIIAVNNGGSDRVGEQLVAAQFGTASRVIGLQSRQPFGRAIASALDAATAEAAATEWIWLLSEDSCPEPEALAHILETVEKAQSVAVAGPKLVDWDRPERIIELGQSLTGTGSRWLLRRQELDQQQYDHLQDVLGVGPVGMLIRRDVWNELGGFDPAYTSYDDGLDFCVRTRLAGYRVEVAPKSRVRFAQSGVAGPRIDRKRKVMRAAHRQARTAHLHRRIAYAPAVPAFFMWLLLPLLAIFRVGWALIREQPGNMIGEFVAAFAVFFRPGAIVASRRRIKQASKVGWSAVRPLRTDRKTVRTAKMIDREAILAAQGRLPREMHFVSTGGLAVLTAMVVASVALTWWALSQTSLFGGGLAPLSDFTELWRNTRTIDGVPADPFAWVLALLGSLTFWHPSLIIVVFIVVAVPLSGLGAWIWAAQITESPAARAVTAIGFALSPVLLGSIASGRVTTLVLAVVLPWLLLAATRCRESWSWAGTASLLAAVALACAPVLIPVALVFLAIGVFSSVRGVLRVLSVAIVPLVLFAPNIITAVLRGSPLDLLRDPGIALPYTPGNTFHLLLGFPEFGLEGWARIFDDIGLGGAPATLLVGVLMLPLALLALLGLYTGRVAVTLLHALFGGLGIITAVVSTHLMLTTSSDTPVAVWTGSGLALYWLAILGLAAIGAETARKAAPAIVSVALIAALIATGPLIVRLVTGKVPLDAASTQLPAIVQVAGEQNPHTRTVVISATDERSLAVDMLVGTGIRLDDIRTAADGIDPSEEEARLAELVSTLASIGGPDVGDALAAEKVNYVLLRHGGDPITETELQRTLDQHPELASAGSTSQGLLWRVNDAAVDTEEGDDSAMLVGTSFGGKTVWAVQLVLIFAMLLLALPTGEVVERPVRRKRPGRAKRKQQPAPAVVAAGGAGTEPLAEAAEAQPALESGAEPVDAEPVDAEHEDAERVDQVEPAPQPEPHPHPEDGDEAPVDEAPVDTVQAGEVQAGEVQAGEVPADEAPAEEAPLDETSAYETPADDATRSDTETGTDTEGENR